MPKPRSSQVSLRLTANRTSMINNTLTASDRIDSLFYNRLLIFIVLHVEHSLPVTNTRGSFSGVDWLVNRECSSTCW